MRGGDPDSIIHLLALARRGDGTALRRLMELLHQELHTLAARCYRQHRSPTLQPTALVSEAFLKLVGRHPIDWKSRTHFFAVAARVMKQILLDHARDRNALKRGRSWKRTTLSLALAPSREQEVEILALHEALEEFSKLDPRAGLVVELHCFSGMKFKEVAYYLKVSQRTVEGDWRTAKAWLHSRLSEMAS